MDSINHIEDSGWEVDIPISQGQYINLGWDVSRIHFIRIGRLLFGNWNLKSFDNLYASLVRINRYRQKVSAMVDQIQEGVQKLKWDIDAFIKNQTGISQKISKVVLTDF